MSTEKFDKLLGLNRHITRRDFLDSALIGTGAALVGQHLPTVASAAIGGNMSSALLTEAWTGYGGIGDYAKSNGNTAAVINDAHRIRFGEFAGEMEGVHDTGEQYELVIVGAGFSGLSAAHYFRKQDKPGRSCLILDNHPVFGGEAKRNEFQVNGRRLICPQGSNTWYVPSEASEMGGLWSELKLPRSFEYREWLGEPQSLKFSKDNFGFMLWEQNLATVGYFYDQKSGASKPTWVVDPWQNGFKDAPLTERVKRDLMTWENYKGVPYEKDDFPRWLDSMSYKDYIETIMGLGPEVTAYCDPIFASGLGLDCGAHSAYVAMLASFPGLRNFPGGDKFTVGQEGAGHSSTAVALECFPGGNTSIARHFVKSLIPEAIRGATTFGDITTQPVDFSVLDRPGQPVRMRLSSTAVAVKHEGSPKNGGPVSVTYLRNGKLHRVKARAVVMASGGWANKYVVRDLPESHRVAYDKFVHAPAISINVALTNWRFMHKLGISACRYFSGVGFSCNIRKPMLAGDYRPELDPDQPTVLTYYMALHYPGLPAREQGIRGRNDILSTSYRDYERLIREQMTHMFGMAGFDAKRDIAGIILNRWGHAYVVAYPGFYYPHDGSQAPSDIIRKPHGRITFAHAELQGFQNVTAAFEEGTRAARDALKS